VLERGKMHNKTFRWKNLKEGDHMEDLCTEVMVILKILKKLGCVDFIFLVQDKEKWEVLLNILMKLWVT
jgi:hypothetical protein